MVYSHLIRPPIITGLNLAGGPEIDDGGWRPRRGRSRRRVTRIRCIASIQDPALSDATTGQPKATKIAKIYELLRTVAGRGR
jgi:hypothetical protein